MRGWRECKECKGTGWRHGRGSVASCHEEPNEPFLVTDPQVITKSEAAKMVGG
jgi:hypothetical protein